MPQRPSETLVQQGPAGGRGGVEAGEKRLSQGAVDDWGFVSAAANTSGVNCRL